MAQLGILGELQFFAWAVLRGVFILVIYDVLRIFRRIVPHGVFWISLEDILYWLLTALLIFELLYRENDGAVRAYALIAIAIGMLFYHQTVSSYLVEWISKFLKWILGILLKPLVLVFQKVVQVGKMVYRFYKKKLKKRVKEFIIMLFS